MSLNRKQFDYLQAMGISIWSSREDKFSSLDGNEDNPVIIEHSDKILAQLNTLKNTPCATKPEIKKTAKGKKLSAQAQLQACVDSRWFKDLLIWLNIETDQVSVDKKHITFGDYTWQFHDKATFEFSENTIKSPEFSGTTPDKLQKRELFNWFNSHRA